VIPPGEKGYLSSERYRRRYRRARMNARGAYREAGCVSKA
jgi:hypothetical protein